MQEESSPYNYLDGLNEQQRAAVVYNDGPELVIAGAGSGKTRVLTYKIVDLIRHGYEPWRILALTFTNKAAREMKERITAIIGEKLASRLWMGTFHSIFLRMLRRHAEEIGYKSGFTIYDTTDSRSLVKTIVKELGLDEKQYKPATICNVISNAKNELTDPDQYMLVRENYEADRRAKRPATGQIYKEYCVRCKRANAMDFDDILVNTNLLLRDHPDIRRHYQEFFRYILVDEYQDTNFAQHLIVNQLTGENRKFCLVGDDAQSIYSFRGANIGNILTLEKRYPDLKVFKLERNYRSTQNIVDAASSLIEKNQHQMRKNVYSENDKGDLIEVVKSYSDMEEAYLVANMITNTKLTYHDSYEEYAVLYRTNAQSRALEESLRKRNIPYRIYGGLSFYQRKEIKDVICYFRLSINPDDDEALRRIINYPTRGIGETTLKKLQMAATLNEKSLWQVICNMEACQLDVNSGTKKKLEGFRDLIQAFIDDNAAGADAYSLGQLIYNRTGILARLAHDNTPESISRQENLSEMLAALKEFVQMRVEAGESETDMRSFLSEVMLATDQDSDDETEGPKVTLMTAHAAKGLEFGHIFVVGVEEELFPSSMSMDTLAAVEEERRLLYVAITRAKLTCVLTYAGSRFRNGQTMMTQPSRFLSEINPRFLNLKRSDSIGGGATRGFTDPTAGYRSRESSYGGYSGYGSRNKTTSTATTRRITPISGSRISTPRATSSAAPSSGTPGEYGHLTQDVLPTGTKVAHEKLGHGVVVSLGELSGEPTVVINFSEVGEKKLLLKFAKLKLL